VVPGSILKFVQQRVGVARPESASGFYTTTANSHKRWYIRRGQVRCQLGRCTPTPEGKD